MNITSNSTYKIIRYILLTKEFKQVEIHKSTECSKGQVHKVVNWLLSRKFIEKAKNKYYIIDPAGIISLFPLFRNMKELLIYRIPLRAEKEKILNEFCTVCGYNRKYAIRKLNAKDPPKHRYEYRKRGPKRKYDHPDIEKILKTIWIKTNLYQTLCLLIK